MHLTVPYSKTRKMSQIKMMNEENHTRIDWLLSKLIFLDREKF